MLTDALSVQAEAQGKTLRSGSLRKCSNITSRSSRHWCVQTAYSESTADEVRTGLSSATTRSPGTLHRLSPTFPMATSRYSTVPRWSHHGSIRSSSRS